MQRVLSDGIQRAADTSLLDAGQARRRVWPAVAGGFS